MANKSKHELTLDRRVVYQIKVPGHLDEITLGWLADMTVETGSDEAGLPNTTFTSKIDQAGLIDLLRRSYSQGLPLISVNHLEDKLIKL